MSKGSLSWTSNFDRLLVDFGCQLRPPDTPRLSFLPWENSLFLKIRSSQLMAILGPILAPTWLHFGAQDRPKSSKNTISRGIKNLIDFCIDFFLNFLPFLDPRRPQAPPKGSQDGPKRRPRGLQKTECPFLFSVMAAKRLQGPPGTPPRAIFG